MFFYERCGGIREMDIFSVLTMVGGLALFLYGMDVLGDGLKKVSGGKLEIILSCVFSLSEHYLMNKNYRFCQFRYYEAFTGGRRHSRGKRGYYCDSLAPQSDRA